MFECDSQTAECLDMRGSSEGNCNVGTVNAKKFTRCAMELTIIDRP